MTTQYFIEREKCPCCLSSTFTKLYESGFDTSPVKEYLETFYAPQGGIEFDYMTRAVYCLLKCDKCDLVFQRDVLNDALMEKLYEHWIDPSKAMLRHLDEGSTEVHCLAAQEIMRIIAYLRRPASSLQFLDFGMGWGEWALMAKGFGCDAYGLELSSKRIEYAVSKGIKVIVGKEPHHLQFDFINTEQVFEHLPRPVETLVELKKLLKPNGVLKISVPPGWDIARKLRIMDWAAPKNSRNSLNAVAPLEHINCFQVRSIAEMAGIAGLKEVKIPLSLQYRNMVCWGGPNRLTRNLIKPLYQTLLNRSTYMFFSN